MRPTVCQLLGLHTRIRVTGWLDAATIKNNGLRGLEKTMIGHWLRRFLTLLLLLLVLLIMAAWFYGHRVLPKTAGTLELAGARADLQILRDAQGIPTIRANSVRDAMFGLGVAHAQDRLWQMETHRRIGSGRLAEAFGEGALDTDRFLRTLGVRRAAQAQWEQVSPASREVLQAYATALTR